MCDDLWGMAALKIGLMKKGKFGDRFPWGMAVLKIGLTKKREVGGPFPLGHFFFKYVNTAQEFQLLPIFRSHLQWHFRILNCGEDKVVGRGRRWRRGMLRSTWLFGSGAQVHNLWQPVTQVYFVTNACCTTNHYENLWCNTYFWRDKPALLTVERYGLNPLVVKHGYSLFNFSNLNAGFSPGRYWEYLLGTQIPYIYI